jgi:UDP-glucose:(heptosyl)LPS alpha-1,3-glucosyltransferase
MRIAIGIVSISESGGLQRDCLALAAALEARGHAVTLHAARCVAPWRSPRPVIVLPVRAHTNHGLDEAFGAAFQAATTGAFDLVIGFNKLPGLDIYYAADPCLATRRGPFWRRLLPRHRTRLALEQACFGPDSSTIALILADRVGADYRAAWGTPADRLILLPPAIAADRARPDLREPAERRDATRRALGFGPDPIVWLWLATQPVTKGLDRVLDALARHRRARLLVVGLPTGDRKTAQQVARAKQLGISERVRWLGHRDDIPEVMAVADILVHPARLDVTGQVILEAMANGLPVIASAVCGFADHVRIAEAGIVIAEPFEQGHLDAALAFAGDPARRARFGAAGVRYCSDHGIARGLHVAADRVEAIAARRAHGD